MALLHYLSYILSFLTVVSVTAQEVEAKMTSLRNIMYLTGQHPVVPDLSISHTITHIALAFMNSNTFNQENPDPAWPLFMSVAEARSKFQPGTKVMVAIGGWGDTAGFSAAARNETGRKRFAANVAKMVEATGADGVDVDWEYPGGNGEDYKQVPNSEKAWEIEAFPLLISEIRKAVGPNKLLSAAVPGRVPDMLAFTDTTVPVLMQSLNFLNVMTYDLMNRRVNITMHHTGVRNGLEAVDAYMSRGAAPDQLNLGFAFYTKYFYTEQYKPGEKCFDEPLGCPTGLMEDPVTGADLGRTGGFSWHDPVPEEVKTSFARAQSQGRYDPVDGGYYFWDPEGAIWWTYDTGEAILKKFPLVVQERKLGGVFAWGLGEDAPAFEHLQAVNEGLSTVRKRDEL